MNLNYLYMLIIIITSLFFSIMIILLSYLLSKKMPNKNKVSVYECGFNPFHNPGKPFSMKFFFIGILFLIFDLEMTYLFPWSMTSNILNLSAQKMIYLFLIFMIMGLMYEWLKGGLEWE